MLQHLCCKLQQRTVMFVLQQQLKQCCNVCTAAAVSCCNICSCSIASQQLRCGCGHVLKHCNKAAAKACSVCAVTCCRCYSCNCCNGLQRLRSSCKWCAAAVAMQFNNCDSTAAAAMHRINCAAGAAICCNSRQNLQLQHCVAKVMLVLQLKQQASMVALQLQLQQRTATIDRYNGHTTAAEPCCICTLYCSCSNALQLLHHSL